MTVPHDRDQLRQTRIKSLTTSVRDLLSGRNKQVSVESSIVSEKIKYHSGILVELRDEQIGKLVIMLNELFNTYVKDETSRGGEAARNCVKSTEKSPEFVDKLSYLDDPAQVQQLRYPVMASFHSCFRRDKSAKNGVVEDFFRCLDLEQMRTDLDRSEFILKLPMFLTMDDNSLQFDRLNDLLKLISDCLTEQNEKLCSLIERIVQELSKGELISFADKIDLTSSSFTSFGVTVEPVLVNKINQMWYKNNLSTSIENMVEDLKQVLREPYAVIARREEAPKNAFKNTMKLMISDGYVDNVMAAQITAKAITDKIQIISDQLVRFSGRIQNIPSKETDGYYGDAAEDIARLLSYYSGILAVILEFVLDYVEGLKDGVDGIEILAANLNTHVVNVNKYVELRKAERKWR